MIPHTRAQERGDRTGIPGQVHHPGSCPERGVIEGRRVGFLARGSISGQRGVDQFGTLFTQALRVDTKTSAATWKHVREHHVGAVDHLQERMASGWVGEVQGQGLFPAVVHFKLGRAFEIRSEAVVTRPGMANQLAPGHFHLDDFGPHVRQQGTRGGRRNKGGDLHDAYARQGRCFCTRCHELPPGARY